MVAGLPKRRRSKPRSCACCRRGHLDSRHCRAPSLAISRPPPCRRPSAAAVATREQAHVAVDRDGDADNRAGVTEERAHLGRRLTATPWTAASHVARGWLARPPTRPTALRPAFRLRLSGSGSRARIYRPSPVSRARDRRSRGRELAPLQLCARAGPRAARGVMPTVRARTTTARTTAARGANHRSWW